MTVQKFIGFVRITITLVISPCLISFINRILQTNPSSFYTILIFLIGLVTGLIIFYYLLLFDIITDIMIVFGFYEEDTHNNNEEENNEDIKDEDSQEEKK